MQVILDHVTDAANNIKTFWFKADRPVRYTAGQFVELSLPHDNPDSRGIKRWFTLSSSPSEELVSITTKFAAENGSSFKAALASLAPGSEVRMSDPMGDFVLPKDTSASLVFVAGGIGVTPMRSMVKSLLDSGETRSITLLYAVNHEDELAFTDVFESATVSYIPLVREPVGAWQGETGVLSPERILELVPKTDNQYYYLSGPEPMVEALVKGLKEQGVDKKRLVTDYFPGYSTI